MAKVIAALKFPDGRVFSHTYTCQDQYSDNQVYWWTEGNAGCDCNRKLFIDREHGTNYDDEQCGDTIKLVSLTVDGVEQEGIEGY